MCTYIIDLVLFKSRVCRLLEGNGNPLLSLHMSQRHMSLCLGGISHSSHFPLCLCSSPGEHLQSKSSFLWLSSRGNKSSHRLRTCSQEADSIALPVKHAPNEGESSLCVLEWVVKLTFRYSGDNLCLLTLLAYARSTRHYLLNKNSRDPQSMRVSLGIKHYWHEKQKQEQMPVNFSADRI